MVEQIQKVLCSTEAKRWGHHPNHATVFQRARRSVVYGTNRWRGQQQRTLWQVQGKISDDPNRKPEDPEDGDVPKMQDVAIRRCRNLHRQTIETGPATEKIEGGHSRSSTVGHVEELRSLQRTSCSLRRSLFDSDPHPNMGCTEWSLLLIWVAQKSDHLPLMNLFTNGLNRSMAMSWLWVLHSVQPLLLHQPVHFLVYPHDWVPNKIAVLFISAAYFTKTSKTKGWSMCWCSIACRHDRLD